MGELYKKINKKLLFLVLAALVFGTVAFWLSSRDEKAKANQPEVQVKAFLTAVQKEKPDFFTDEIKNIQTPELLKLQEKNKELQATFVQNRTKDIDDLKQKISDTIHRNWLGWGKTDADKEKIRQVEFLEKIATKPYQKNAGLSENLLSLLSDLKNSGHFRTYYNEGSKMSQEVLPTLTYQDKGQLTTAETPYEIALPQKDSPETKLNQKNGTGETELTYTLKNSNLNNPKVYDNRALYGEIRKGIDQLLTTQTDGLNQAFIIKNPLSLQVQGEAGLLTLDYDLTTELTAAEDQGAIILTDQKGVKQYVLTPPALTDTKKQTPGEVKFKLNKNSDNNYQLQIEIKISKVATFPLLISYNILPALTRYMSLSK